MSQLKGDIRFMYPDTYSLDQLKQFTEIKEVLLRQQTQLKNALQNIHKLLKLETEEKYIHVATEFNLDETNTEIQICPICGASYGPAVSFLEFHEHVVNHFK